MPSCMAGGCPHPRECEDYGACRYEMEESRRLQTEQSEAHYAEQCEAQGHEYHGDEVTMANANGDPDHERAEAKRLAGGRCYCGAKRYPIGGRAEIAKDGTLYVDLPSPHEVVFDFERDAQPVPGDPGFIPDPDFPEAQ